MIQLLATAWRWVLGVLRLRIGEDGPSRGAFLRNVSMLAGGTAVGQALGILVTPVLCRIYSVEDFGQYQVYASLMGFATVAVAWRYELAVLLPAEPRAAASIVVLGLLLVIGTSSALALALWMGGMTGLLPRSFEQLGPNVWWMPVGMLGAGFYLLTSYWAIRAKAYPQIAGTRLAQSVAQSVSQLVFGLTGQFGISGLVIGDIFGRSTGAPSLAFSAWKTHRGLFTAVRWRDIWAVAVRYRKFPLVSSGSALINSAGYALPSLMLESHYGAQVLGWFALGDRLLAIPTTLVGSAISQVYISEAATLARSDIPGLRRLVVAIPKRLFFLGVGPFLLVALFGPVLFEFVFGAAWREAGHYAQLLAAMNCFNFLIWPLMPTLGLLERQTWQLVWDVGRMLMTVGTLWLAFALKCSPGQAIAAFGVARAVACAAFFGLCLLAIRRLNSAGRPLPTDD